MGSKLAYLPLYVRDWRSDPQVQLLPWDARMLYLDMLLLSWELGPLPDDADGILRALGCPAVNRTVTDLLLRFFVRNVSGWTNARLEEVRVASVRKVKHLQRISRKGVAARRRGQPHGQPSGQPRAPEPEPEGSTYSELFPDPEGSSPSKVSKTPSLRSGDAAGAAGVSKARAEATGPQAEAIRIWSRIYLEERGYAWSWNELDAVAIARCRKRAAGDLGELERRARLLIASPPSDWFAQNTSPTTLASKWNELAQVVTIDKAEQQARQNRERLRRLAEKVIPDATSGPRALPPPADRPARVALE